MFLHGEVWGGGYVIPGAVHGGHFCGAAQSRVPYLGCAVLGAGSRADWQPQELGVLAGSNTGASCGLSDSHG